VDTNEWLAALRARHLADLTPSEVTRALRALSSCYVERREKLAGGGALDGAGKRAAFALFYGPQHFFITREIVRAIGQARAVAGGGQADGRVYRRIVDLGCGTGTAGAAAALETGARVEGTDLNPWAVSEANWTYRALGVRGRATAGNITRMRIRASAETLVLAAYAINELPEATHDLLLDRLNDAHARGASVLVIEPIGRRVNRWWTRWAESFLAGGGRADDWRFAVSLPAAQRELAKAAGLGVQGLTARSLFLGPRVQGPS
jgi:SAM-dependent methyltransferase